MFLRLRFGVRALRRSLAFDRYGSGPPQSGALSARREGMPSLQAKDWSKEKFPEVKKTKFHLPEATVDRKEDDIDMFYQSSGLVIDGAEKPKPILTLEECKAFGKLWEAMKNKGFEKPMPIQSVSWPIALSGRDMVGNVRTGSGKTLAFLLPALLHIESQRPFNYEDGPIALVLAPTRELGEQTMHQAKEFGRSFRTYSTLVCGGVSKVAQFENLKKFPELIVATPGRLIDFLNTGAISLNQMSYLVLDEADRMLDMGFEIQLRNIMKHVRPDRQTTMWSATWPKEVRSLANDFMKKPIVVSEHRDEVALNSDITHIVQFIPSENKLQTLQEILHGIDIGPMKKVLIFCNTKLGCEIVSQALRKQHIEAHAMHGDMSYFERQRVYRGLESHIVHVVVASDVASRGLDFKGIHSIINYDMPRNIEDYVHRCGRTGRAGEKGTAFTLFTREDIGVARDLVSLLSKSKQVIPTELQSMVRSPQAPGRPQQQRFGTENSRYYNGRYEGLEQVPRSMPQRFAEANETQRYPRGQSVDSAPSRFRGPEQITENDEEWQKNSRMFDDSDFFNKSR